MFNPRRFFAFRRNASALPGPYAAGLRALEAGRCEEACGLFTAALEAAGDDAARAAALNKRGVAQVERNRRDDAAADFLGALEADARFVPAIVNIGNLLLEAGDLDEAVVHYQAALRYDDKYAPAHQNLGIALRRLGKRAEAIRHLRAATRLETGGRRR